METFSALLALSAGNSPVTGEFPAQRPVTRGFDVFFDLRLNKGLSKQSWDWWFETPSRSLWRQRNAKKFNDTQTVPDFCLHKHVNHKIHNTNEYLISSPVNMAAVRPLATHISDNFYGLVQDCSNSSALAMELLQSCSKPSMYLQQSSPIQDFTHWDLAYLRHCAGSSLVKVMVCPLVGTKP